MAYEWTWIDTQLPKDVVKIMEKDLCKFNDQTQDSRIFHGDPSNEIVDTEVRSSRHCGIPDSHWSAGFIMHYANIVNRENYLYDIIGLDGGTMQYGIYDVGGHYKWHPDFELWNCSTYPRAQFHGPNHDRAIISAQVNSEYARKLSFSLQLTDPSEYEGGNLEILDAQGKVHAMSQEQGRLIFFDSRITHRVTPVTKGQRRSLVGWIVGPRWK